MLKIPFLNSCTSASICTGFTSIINSLLALVNLFRTSQIVFSFEYPDPFRAGAYHLQSLTPCAEKGLAARD